MWFSRAEVIGVTTRPPAADPSSLSLNRLVAQAAEVILSSNFNLFRTVIFVQHVGPLAQCSISDSTIAFTLLATEDTGRSRVKVDLFQLISLKSPILFRRSSSNGV